MANAPSGRASSSSTSSDTPPNVASNFDHFVTQWMSRVIVSAGSSRNSAADQVLGLPTIPSMPKLQSSNWIEGVGPAVKTGQPGSTYCPGGSRSPYSSCERRRPPNPLEMKPLMATPILNRREGPLGAGRVVGVFAPQEPDPEPVLAERDRLDAE